MLRPRVVDVGEVLTRMAPMLRRLVGEHIDLVLSLDPSPLRVKVDPTQLEQVLLNLAINARDAMENGGRLAIECRPVLVAEEQQSSPVDVKPGRYVIISVTDNGVGMDTRDTRARLRAVLHDQGRGPRHRARAGHGLRHREAERRRHPRRQRRRPRLELSGVFPELE